MKTGAPLLLSLLLVFCVAGAVTDLTPVAPEHQARYRNLIAELRCLVCQNQSLADSDADLAADMRHEIADMLARGDSDEEIIGFLVARYGEFVRYRPPVELRTLALWAGPFVLLIFGLGAVILMVRRRSREQAPEMSRADARLARELLERHDSDRH